MAVNFSDASGKAITDLRVQLYKKRQQTTRSDVDDTRLKSRASDFDDSRHHGRASSDFDDSHHHKRRKAREVDADDSLENAEVDTTDDIDDGENIRSALSANR